MADTFIFHFFVKGHFTYKSMETGIIEDIIKLILKHYKAHFNLLWNLHSLKIEYFGTSCEGFKSGIGLVFECPIPQCSRNKDGPILYSFIHIRTEAFQPIWNFVDLLNVSNCFKITLYYCYSQDQLFFKTPFYFSENGQACENPQRPNNTMIFGNGRMPGSIGDMIYYFCRNNMVRIGNYRRVCTRCGKWTPRAPICRDPPPPIIIRNRNRKNRKHSRKNKQRRNGERRV